MAADLSDESLPASFLIRVMCMEALVCLTGEDYGNQVEWSSATFDVKGGIIVTDANGRRFRLHVAAEELDKKGGPGDDAKAQPQG